MKRRLFILTVCFAAAILATGSLAQESATEQTFAQLEMQLQARRAEKQQLRSHIVQSNQQIDELQSLGKLNYFQRQKLEDLLRKTQDLSNQLQQLNVQVEELEKEFRDAGERLLAEFEREISALLNGLKNATPERVEKERSLRKIKELRAKAEQVKRKIQPTAQSTLYLGKVEITPNDSPRKIRQKADLLKDQEEKLREVANTLRQQKQELQKEVELRNRIDDLVTDLALFDQQEEVIGNVGVTGAAVNRPVDGETAGVQEGFAQGPGGLIVSQKNFDFSTLSTEQLEELLLQLTAQQKRLETKADSLGNRAQTFYQAAEKQKNQ